MPYSLPDEILQHLTARGTEPVSGQVLAGRFGVTRAAVWKAVESLRKQGVPVVSLPGRGYRLGSGRRGVRAGEVRARIPAGGLGLPCRHLPITGSTNREAEAWARRGAPHGALVTADHQSDGRGRLGRPWLDRPGETLLFSLVLRPDLPAARAPTLTFAAAVALAESLGSWIPEKDIAIKWPNDVLLSGRKAAGILLEMRAEAQRVEHVILGVGVNVGGTAVALDETIRPLATTVAEHAHPAPDRLDVLCGFLDRFGSWYDRLGRDGFEPVRAEWNRWFRARNRPVRVRTGNRVVAGLALGLTRDGGLVVEQSDGGRVEILAGDVEAATTRATA